MNDRERITNHTGRHEAIDLSPTLKAVSIPVDAENTVSILSHLPDTNDLTYYLTPDEPGKRSLSPIGRKLVASNWEHFRDMNGWLKDDWETLKRDPDGIYERIELLRLQKERYFDLLQDYVKNSADETEFVGRMKRSFETRIRNMEITAFRAELEVDNSPWSGRVGLVTEKLFPNIDSNKARFGAMSHILSKRRVIKSEVDAIIDQDESLRDLTSFQYKLMLTTVEHRFAQRVAKNLGSMSEEDIKAREITGLIDTIEKGQDEVISFNEFVKNSIPDYLRSGDSDVDLTPITAAIVEAVTEEEEAKPRGLRERTTRALVVTSIAIAAADLASLLSGNGTNTPKIDSQLAIEQNHSIAEIATAADDQEVLPAAISYQSSTNIVGAQVQASWLSGDTASSDTTSYAETDQQDPDSTITSVKEEEREVIDSVDTVEAETEWYELAGIDFSKPITITLSPELSQAVGAGSESLVINMENHTYDGLTGREDDLDDPDFTGDEAKKRGLVVLGNYDDNIFLKGHSFTEDVWKSSNLENWAFEFLRRIAKIQQENGGELPGNLKDGYIELSQGNVIRTARLLNVTVLPEESFTIGVYNDGKPARYMIGEGDHVIDFGDLNEDLNEPGIVHMVTCINPVYDGLGRTKGFEDRVVVSWRLEEKPSLPPSSDLIASNTDAQPNFASIGAENITVQDLRQVPDIFEKATSPESMSVLQNIFTNYKPAAEALRQSNTPEDIAAFVGNIPVASGPSVNRHLLFGRGDSLGSTPVQVINGVPVPTHLAFQIDRATEISPLLPAEEIFQRFQIYKTVTDNWPTWQTLGYTAESWAKSFNSGEARTIELFQVLWLQEHGLNADGYPEVYTFSINGITYSTALEAGNALAALLNNNNILDRQITVDDIRNMVNKGTFNEIMMAFHEKTGRNLLDFIGMSRENPGDEDGEDPYKKGSLDVQIPSDRLVQTVVN